jgi:hypothetical protein
MSSEVGVWSGVEVGVSAGEGTVAVGVTGDVSWVVVVAEGVAVAIAATGVAVRSKPSSSVPQAESENTTINVRKASPAGGRICLMAKRALMSAS